MPHDYEARREALAFARSLIASFPPEVRIQIWDNQDLESIEAYAELAYKFLMNEGR